jgi:hypothetical protein
MEEIAQAERELGDEVAYFGPSYPNIIAGSVLSVLVMAGGIALLWLAFKEFRWNMPFYAEKGMCWFAFIFMNALGACLCLLCPAGLYWMTLLAKRGVSFRSEGLLYRDSAQMLAMFWEDIAAIKEIHLYERPPILKGPAKLALPKMKSKSYLVITSAGTEIGFDGNTVDRIHLLGDVLRKEATSRHIPWTIEEVQG